MEITRAHTQDGRRLEVVRQAFARLEAFDPQAVAHLCHDEFELRWMGLGDKGHTHRGKDAFQMHLGDLSHGWEEVHMICDRLFERTNRVLALYHLLGDASQGGTAASPHAAVIRIRDDRLWRWDAFQDPAHSFDWLAAEARLA